MKNTEKKFIIILILISIIIIAIVATITNIKEKKEEIIYNNNNSNENEYVNVLQDGTKLNTSNKLQETKTIDGMEINNFQLSSKDGVTVLLGTITNNSNEVKGDYPVSIKVLDNKGNEIVTVGGYIGALQPGESTQLNCSASFDYANAYDFEITKK